MRIKRGVGMNKYKATSKIIEKIKAKINDPRYKMDNRISSKDFPLIEKVQ